MKFYWFLLLIIVFINALFFFTSVGEYAKSIAINFSDPSFIAFSILFIIMLFTTMLFAMGRR